MTKKTETKTTPVEPQVIEQGLPIGERIGTVIVSHEKRDGSKVLLTVITN